MYQLTQNKKKNPSNIFVKDCIVTALFQLLKDNSFEKITITQIVQRAGVSKMGFYRNYISKEDVIETYIFELFLETLNEIQSKRTLNLQFENVIVTLLHQFRQHADKIKLLLNQNLEFLLYNCYRKAFNYLMPNNRNSVMREYFYNIFLGEIFNLELTWIKTGMKETPEELTRIYFKFLKFKLNNL